MDINQAVLGLSRPGPNWVQIRFDGRDQYQTSNLIAMGRGKAIDEPVFGRNRQLSEFQGTRHPEMPTRIMVNLIGSCLVLVLCVPQRLVR